MKVNRCIINLGIISLQYKKETGKDFDLNDLIKWVGNRHVIEIDDDLYFEWTEKLI